MFGVTVTQDDVENFVEHLAGKGWVFARELRAQLGLNDRHVRALAEGSKGRVLSGQQGYRLTAEATKDELERCINRQLAQASKTRARMRHTEDVWSEAQLTESSAF